VINYFYCRLPKPCVGVVAEGHHTGVRNLQGEEVSQMMRGRTMYLLVGRSLVPGWLEYLARVGAEEIELRE
jgi:hypothetical protein